MSELEATPIPGHLASEFFVWLWWQAEERANEFSLGGDVGTIAIWVDERLSFRGQQETKATAVLTGENPSTTLEARAALAGGKVVQDIRVGMRRDDREFHVTLKSPGLDLSQVKFTQTLGDALEEAVYDRMSLYDELVHMLGAIFKEFCAIRVSAAWGSEVLPALRAWLEPEPA